MGINSMYGINRMRFGGLASGLDTDTIVKDLMRIEQMKVDKLKQQRQIVEWKKEDYRKTTNLLRSFYDEYFDILYAKINMTSTSTYSTLKVESSHDNYITATASADAFAEDKTITKIELAKGAYAEGVSATSPLASRDLTGDIDLNDHSITITINGITRLISFDENDGNNGIYNDIALLKNDLQTKINNAFGENRIEVTIKDGNQLVLDGGTNTVTLSEYSKDDNIGLGFGLSKSNRINLDSTLFGLKEFSQFNNALEFEEDISFTINGVEFTFSGNETLRTVMNRINNSDAGVTLTYNTLKDQFLLRNKETGAAHSLTFKDGIWEDGQLIKGGNFLEALGLTHDDTNVVAGKDAIMVMDNMTIYRSTNSFTIDGITYNLTREFDAGLDGLEPITLTMSRDVDKAFDNIKSFIDSYNKILESLNGTLSQERFSDFPPLTDEQREAMTEKEIELWEEKARSGLLNNDSILQKIVYDMRRALIDPVKNVGINLSSIGIKTGSYSEGGRLHIDERKLKEALREKGDEIMRLFSNKSQINYSPDNDVEQRTIRYEESGLVQRLSDILQDNIRTRRDKNGKKGTLLEKAGIVGDASEMVNLMDDQLKDMNKRIDDAIDRMYRAENRYWAQFTALERALQQMNAQSAWLFQQLSGGGMM